MPAFDNEMIALLSITCGALLIGTIVGQTLKFKITDPDKRKTVDNLNARVFGWWIMCGMFVIAVLLKGIGTVVLFALTSFLALREYITLTPTRRGDHRALFLTFFVLLPLQYYYVATRWYGMFITLIPVYGFLLIAIRAVFAGDAERFLERTAKVHWGLMVCVYFISHVPALLMLEIPGYPRENAKLLFFFIVVVQMCDVLQYTWGKAIGRHKITPTISPGKTWEGFIGGVLSATLLGSAIYWVTPFNLWQATLMSFMISVMGFAGDVTMSAVKRDIGVKDYSQLIPGHGGMLDRIDSLCFAAPVFFHATRYFFTP